MASGFYVDAQILKQMVVETTKEEVRSIVSSCTTKDGVLIFKTAMQGLKFEFEMNKANLLSQTHFPENNEYVLCVVPNPRQYIVTISCDGYVSVSFEVMNIKAIEPHFFIVNPIETIVLTDTIVITETVMKTDTITNVITETVLKTDTVTKVVTKTKVVRERVVVPKTVTREETITYIDDFFLTLHAGLALPVGKFGGSDPEEFLPERLQIGAGSQGGGRMGSSFGIRISEYNENFGMFLDYSCSFNKIKSKIYDHYSLSDMNGKTVEMVRNFRYNNHSTMAGVNLFYDFHGNLGLFCEFGGGLNFFHMRDIEYTNDKSTSFKFTKYMNVPFAMKLAVEAGGGVTFFQRRMFIGAYYKNMGNCKVYIKDDYYDFLEDYNRPLRLKVNMLYIRFGILFDILN